MRACRISQVWLSATPWTVAHQAPLSMGFTRQEYWSRLPFPSSGNLPDPGIEPASPSLAGRFFTTEPSGKALMNRFLFFFKNRFSFTEKNQAENTQFSPSPFSLLHLPSPLLWTPCHGVLRLHNWRTNIDTLLLTTDTLLLTKSTFTLPLPLQCITNEFWQMCNVKHPWLGQFHWSDHFFPCL